MAFSARIRQLRRERRMTLTALAEKAGISRGYMSEIENERATDPSAAVLRAIAQALDTTTAVLMDEDPTIVSSDIPDSLRLAQEKFNIPEGDLPTLAAIKFRNYQPISAEDWKFLYESIKRSMPKDAKLE